ncbi:FMN-linked oxidoreductase [Hyphopichia burtonii NRRL Y-1933]|uniref:FMN-linked oxidoreductase n=1 Tax=Hyphopichia burtonii NRRL Y-1933 TaxID=984485 RepID=A0A1E4RLJ3_9ASCO|nr:FMN-linked oxidoreductase [Hyphopichia burtonii NRRL Y-1933]ODV68132.1 FMN-linked oxidoreductase [Hyphopichia burtonii NRRL Y-1933]
MYANKLCLAPMVRSGELPTRIMALNHGADLVWSPEIVDKKLIQCTRIANEELNTIDFIDSNFKPTKKTKRAPVVFRTYPKLESGKLIFQIGSSDPELAVQAASKIIKDVDGIDLNCGCPKPFSTHSGMGAALLTNPTQLVAILQNLVEKIGKPNKKPISCKIRLLDDKDAKPTLELLEKLVTTGIENITIHCRTRDMRNRDHPIHNFLPELVKYIQSKNISCIINGALQSRHDFENLKTNLGLANVGGMIAESAESNPSVFNKENPLTWSKVLIEFIETAIKFDNHPTNTKYVLLNQIPGKLKYYNEFCKLKSNEDYYKLAKQIENDDKIKLKYCMKDKLIPSNEYDSQFKDSDKENHINKKRKLQ